MKKVLVILLCMCILISGVSVAQTNVEAEQHVVVKAMCDKKEYKLNMVKFNEEHITRLNTINPGDVFYTSGFFREEPENKNDRIMTKGNRPVVIIAATHNGTVLACPLCTGETNAIKKRIEVPSVDKRKVCTYINYEQIYTLNLYNLTRKAATYSSEVVKSIHESIIKDVFMMIDTTTEDADDVITEDTTNTTQEYHVSVTVPDVTSVAVETSDIIDIIQKRTISSNEAVKVYNFWYAVCGKDATVFCELVGDIKMSKYYYIRKKCMLVLIEAGVLNKFDWRT